MKIESNNINKVITIKENLNELVNYGGVIKRQDILNAEEISFNKALPSNIIYDEYGFINKKENLNKK